MVVDARRSRFVPDRWLVPVRPRPPALRRAFAALPLDERRRLARLSARPDLDMPPADREMVSALAEARIAARLRSHVAAAILGVLVLMTIWGFGRSGFPGSAGVFFAAGAATGALTWAIAAAQVRRRQRAAHEVRSRTASGDDG